MRRLSQNQTLGLLVLTLLVAALLRLPDLTGLPPGLHYDEAANALLAGNIGLRGDRPIFISSYTGKEVLFFYLAGGMMALIGESVFALRLTAAFTGLLTIAATYWLGREMRLDRRITLIAVILLAVSFWHLLFSRLGFRAITQPLLQALTLAALLRGLRRNERQWLAIAGGGLGLTAYTYLAARLFPVLLLLALLPLLARASRRRWGQLLLVLVVGLLLLAPLLFYFVNHPDAFWVRITQVSPETSGGLTLWESFSRSFQMLFLVGDPYIRFNLPERPLLNSFWGTMMLVGWGYALWSWRRHALDWERFALALLILNPLLMLLPTALATNEIVPSNLRAIGLIPLLFYLPGVGLLVLLQSVENWLNSRMVTVTVLSVGFISLVLGSLNVDRLYFEVWGKDPALFYETDGGLTAVSRYLNSQDTGDATIYVAARHYQHPTLAFLSDRYADIKWLPGSHAFVLPAEGPSLYLYPENSPLPPWVEPYVGPGNVPGSFAPPHIAEPFTAYQLEAPPDLQIAHETAVNFGNAITLLGYSVSPGITGETMPLTLYWQIAARPARPYATFVHLEDMWGHRWSQVEVDAYPTAQWEPGEIIVQHVALPVPHGAPPNPYRLRLGIFDPATGNRLPQLDNEGRYAGSAFLLEFAGVLKGELPEETPLPPFPIHEQITSGLRLLGYQRGNSRVATGDTLGLALWWEATRSLPPLTTRLELLRTDNTGRVLANTQPVHDTYPFHYWYTPQFLIDHVDPRVPVDFPPGDFRLKLRLLDENDEILFATDLGLVTVEATIRTFALPPLQFQLDAHFGNEIALAGYDIENTGPNQFELRLAWRALQPPAADYTVFVHVLDQDGTCCIWQQDLMPQQNQYPTGRWQAEEVVIDTYQITLPEDLPGGKYPVEVGFYIAETGQRLQVTGADAPAADAVYLRPLSP